MEVVVALLAKELFARAVRKELRRTGHTQHPAITRAGLLAMELL